jgi:hypothetical protein
MRPDGVDKSIMGNEVAGVLSLKTQSPSTLGWRLRVELRHICRFEKTVRFGIPPVPMDSRRYRDCSHLPYVDAYDRLPDDGVSPLPGEICFYRDTDCGR